MMRARGASLRQVAAVALRGGGRGGAAGRRRRGRRGGPGHPGARLVAVVVAGGRDHRDRAGRPAAARGVAAPGPPRRRPRRAARRGRPPPDDRGPRGGSPTSRWSAPPSAAWSSSASRACRRPAAWTCSPAAAPVLVAIPVALLVMRGLPARAAPADPAGRAAARGRDDRRPRPRQRGGAGRRAARVRARPRVRRGRVRRHGPQRRGAAPTSRRPGRPLGADAVVTAPEVGPGDHPGRAAPDHRRAGRPARRHGRGDHGNIRPGPARCRWSIVDPRQYAALIAATPAPRSPPPRWPGRAARRTAAARCRCSSRPPRRDILRPAQRAVGGRPRAAAPGRRPLRTASLGVPAGSQFAVLPRWALGAQAPPPTVMAMTGPRLDTAALIAAVHRAVPGAQVTLRSRVLAAISGAPLPHGGFVTFAQGAAAAAGVQPADPRCSRWCSAPVPGR